MSLFNILNRVLLAGIGMQEKAKEFIDELVKRGELSESEGARIIKEWSEKIEGTREEFDRGISDLINRAIEKVNLPTRGEIDELNEKIRALTKRVKRLEEAAGEKGRSDNQ